MKDEDIRRYLQTQWESGFSLNSKIKGIIRYIFQSFGTDIRRLKVMRESMEFVNNNLKGQLTGVEIGVFQGVNAEVMLKNMNIKKLYLIDPFLRYEEYKESFWRDNVFGFDVDDCEIKVHKRLKDFKNCQIMSLYSEEAVRLIPNELDFIYIDGNHSYEYVIKDIELYYPKVRDGGVIAGHDFGSQECMEVKNAVMDFINKTQEQLFTDGTDWWIVKGVKRMKNL